MTCNKGFFLVYELLCFGFAALLLAHTAQCFTACFKVQERVLHLQGAWEVAQLAAFEQETDAPYLVVSTYEEQNGLRLLEVRVYDEAGERLLCSLVRNVP